MRVRIGAGFWMVVVMLCGTTRGASTWCISEVLTGPVNTSAGSLGGYVEIYAPSTTAGQQFDLVVFDAGLNTGRQWNIYSVTTLTTVGGADSYIVHTGNWTHPSPPANQRVEAALNYGYSFGVARTLVLYDHVTGLSPGFEQRENLLAAGESTDAITYQISPISGASFEGEPVHTITIGDALYRDRDQNSYTDQIITGSVDANLQLAGGQKLNPGRINELTAAAHMPEPLSALGWWAGLAMMGFVRHRQPAADR
ncbi:hypothetical protein HED60_10005 [Planctomycetales bacterium ZRK34]|nr:hypothetical protein HED60_10005 [Planctomycetales bacterium ZRK34]